MLKYKKRKIKNIKSKSIILSLKAIDYIIKQKLLFKIILI